MRTIIFSLIIIIVKLWLSLTFQPIQKFYSKENQILKLIIEKIDFLIQI
jgi:hypothetical protein